MYTEHLIREIQTNYSENLRSIEKMLLDLATKTMGYHCIDVNLEGDCYIRIEINKSKKPLITSKENNEFRYLKLDKNKKE